MNRSAARRWLPRVVGTGIGLLCLGYMLISFEWAAILPVLWAAQPLWLLGAGSLSIILYWMLRALRWFILLRRAGVAVNPFDLYMCSAVSLSLAIITPFQSGEALKVEWLRRYGLRDRLPGYSSFAVERLADLLAVGVLAAVSLWGQLSPGGRETLALGGLALLLLLLGGAGAIRLARPNGPLRGTLWYLQRYVSNGPTVMQVLLVTFLAWIMVALGWQVCLHSIGVDLTVQEAVALMSVVTVINILSCVPGAVGVSEVSSAEFLVRQGQTVPLAQAGALVLRFYGVLILLLGAGHLVLWNVVRGGRQGPAEVERTWRGVLKIKQMFRERRNREALYCTAEYWDMKARREQGDAVSMWPNNYLNAYYHREQLQILQHYLPDVKGAAVLDVGCGTGRISRYLAAHGATVLGLDFSPQAIAAARERSGPDNPRYRIQSIFDLTDEHAFDILVSLATLTVACRDRAELLDALRRLRRALRPSGRAVFLEPIHRGFLHRVLEMDMQEFCAVMTEAGFHVQAISHLHWWPARLALAYIQLPRWITAAGYYLGEAFMRLTGRRHMGDYQAVLATVGERPADLPGG